MLRALVIAASLAACGGGSKKDTNKPAQTSSSQEPLSNKQPDMTPAAAPMTPAQQAMAAMARFEQQLCACKDADCAKRVSDEMTNWSMEHAKQQKEPLEMSEEDQKRAVAIGTHMAECMEKAMGMGASTP